MDSHAELPVIPELEDNDACQCHQQSQKKKQDDSGSTQASDEANESDSRDNVDQVAATKYVFSGQGQKVSAYNVLHSHRPSH